MTTRAKKVWDTYINGYSELLCTPVENFDSSFDEGIKKILASVIREIVNEFQYDNADWQSPNEHMIMNVKDVLELINELENLK